MSQLPAVFDLQGPQFLAFYAVLFIGIAILTAILRSLMRGPFDYDQLAALRLTPYDVAYLQGGRPRAFQAALTGLLNKGYIHITGDAVSVVYNGTADWRVADDGLEQELLRQVDSQKISRLADLFVVLRDEFDRMHAKLQRASMLVSEETIRMMRLVTFIGFSLVAVTGGLKIWVGVQRHKPVLYLLIMVGITVLLALVSLAGQYFRTKRGDVTLRELKKKNEALRTAATSSGTLSSTDVALGVGLFGLAALPLAYTELHDWAKQTRQQDGGGDFSYGASDSGGGSSCSSGGDGGGDGGGGGCGGCGGGGGD